MNMHSISCIWYKISWEVNQIDIRTISYNMVPCNCYYTHIMDGVQTLGVHFMQLSDLYVVGPCSFSLETMGLGQKCHCSFNRLLFGSWIKHKFQEPLESSLLLCRSCITPSLGKKGIASYKWIIVGKCFNSLTAKKQCFLECRQRRLICLDGLEKYSIMK